MGWRMNGLRSLCWAALALGLAAWLPASAAPAPPGYAAAAEVIVKPYVEAGNFSGVVLVAKDGRPIFRKAFGLADREWNVAATPETRFRLGSITKQFTAAAILQLAEQGKLSLDDPISKYYPDAPASWAAITLKHLLTHTSGIPSYTAISGFFRQSARTDRTPEEIIALTRDKPLEFKPGEKFAYDNTGYILLGYVIEKVSGQTYQAYLANHLLMPLGLKNTGYDVSETILPLRAAGYSLSATGPRNAPYLSMTLPYAAGSLYSTADDLLAWDQALHADRPLKGSSVAAMFTDYGFKYGFGQFIEVEDGHRIWNHFGGINGFATALEHLPDDGLTIVVLSNIEQAPVGRIAHRLSALYFNPKLAPVTTGPTTASERTRCLGRYQLSPLVTIEVMEDGGRLFAQATGQPKAELFRESDSTFFVTAAPILLTFAPGDKAPEVVVHQGGKDTLAKRIG
jgi:D-alanyl-D-alanine carboxypeptidase